MEEECHRCIDVSSTEPSKAIEDNSEQSLAGGRPSLAVLYLITTLLPLASSTIRPLPLRHHSCNFFLILPVSAITGLRLSLNTDGGFTDRGTGNDILRDPTTELPFMRGATFMDHV